MRTMKQRTIKKPVTIEGIGLQTGKKVSLTLKGSPAGSGINFIRVDLPGKPSLDLRSIEISSAAGQAERRTTLSSGPLQVQTTEHLFAALAGAGIDNMTVETDNVELPGADGSAKEFLSAVKRAGILEQDLPKKAYGVTMPIWCKAESSMLAIFPDDGFRVSYTLSYPGIGVQFFDAVIDEAVFEREIAPARTFCSEAEASELLKRGLGKGADYKNTLVMGPGGPVNNRLRFPDEPVRHKVLDLIGDLYLAGGAVKGHVVAIKSGHKLNMELVNKLRAQNL
ncbi:MAG: UDP-3-O-acyl-N-acetylglucosamine deacetylase [Candidatus Omnitrophota bacterium]